jgi:hypothetical protein
MDGFYQLIGLRILNTLIIILIFFCTIVLFLFTYILNIESNKKCVGFVVNFRLINKYFIS